MKSHSIEWTRIEHGSKAISLNPARRAEEFLCLAGKALLALAPALAIVIGAAWLAGNAALAIYLQAALWTSGFLFFGLAIDAPGRSAALLVGTGIALPVLALLSASGAAEPLILAATLLALWVAWAIFRR